jgi:hypothetical protein
MIATIAVFLLGSSLAAQVHSDAAEDRTMADARVRNEIYERKLFAERFNALVTALSRFGESYNRSNGTLLPADKVIAIQKAWRKLERTDVFGKGKSR